MEEEKVTNQVIQQPTTGLETSAFVVKEKRKKL